MADILVVDDEESLSYSMQLAVRRAGHECRVAHTGEGGLAEFARKVPDLALVDIHLPDISGLEFMGRIRDQGWNVPVIVITGFGTVASAVAAMKQGAVDFLQKPLSMEEVVLVVDRVLQHQRLVDNLDYFRSRERAVSGVESILGTSPQIQAVRATILKLVRTPAVASRFPPSVLITGETGTGKDLVARAIHYQGPRADNPFVHVNCTALPEDLFEAELFGHMKGAFTGATSNKKGLMEVADGGTIFLDEIGHLKPALQAKLLAAIERKHLRPVGGTDERRIDVHVIAATNRDLEAAVGSGEFRDDLYHRLRVVPIAVAPLRERSEDVAVLARHFVGLYSSRFGIPVEGISAEGLRLLVRYDWPGNVRELSHLIEHAVLMSDQRTIGAEHLQIPSRGSGGTLELVLPKSRTVSIDFESGRPTLEEVEHAILEAALEHCGHNVSRVARVLGITREAVRYRLDKHRRPTAENAATPDKIAGARSGGSGGP